jgi:hypothetical protein
MAFVGSLNLRPKPNGFNRLSFEQFFAVTLQKIGLK